MIIMGCPEIYTNQYELRISIRIPFKPEFFFRPLFQLIKLKALALRGSQISLMFIRSSRMIFIYIHIHIYSLSSGVSSVSQIRAAAIWILPLGHPIMNIEVNCSQRNILISMIIMECLGGKISIAAVSARRSMTNSQSRDFLSMWLGSSVDRALQRYRKIMGSILIQA